MPDRNFTPQERLRKFKDFEKIFKLGARRSGNNLTFIQLPAPGRRMGFIISHQIKGAVIRNKLKRRLREIYRQNKVWFKGDSIIIAYKGTESLSYPQLKEEVLKLTSR